MSLKLIMGMKALGRWSAKVGRGQSPRGSASLKLQQMGCIRPLIMRLGFGACKTLSPSSCGIYICWITSSRLDMIYTETQIVQCNNYRLITKN